MLYPLPHNPHPPVPVTTCSLISGVPLTACQAAAQPPILWDMGEDGQPCGKTERESSVWEGEVRNGERKGEEQNEKERVREREGVKQ